MELCGRIRMKRALAALGIRISTFAKDCGWGWGRRKSHMCNSIANLSMLVSRIGLLSVLRVMLVHLVVLLRKFECMTTSYSRKWLRSGSRSKWAHQAIAPPIKNCPAQAQRGTVDAFVIPAAQTIQSSLAYIQQNLGISHEVLGKGLVLAVLLEETSVFLHCCCIRKPEASGKQIIIENHQVFETIENHQVFEQDQPPAADFDVLKILRGIRSPIKSKSHIINRKAGNVSFVPQWPC